MGNVHEIYIYAFCFLIKERHHLMRKQKVHTFNFFFQIATFLKTGEYIYIYLYIYIDIYI